MIPFRLAAPFLAAILALLSAGCAAPEQTGDSRAPSGPPASQASTPTPSRSANVEQSRALAKQELSVASPGRARLAAEAYSLADLRLPSEPVDREVYGHFDDNPVKRVAEHPVSTFGADVDTGAYANVRRMLLAGR